MDELTKHTEMHATRHPQVDDWKPDELLQLISLLLCAASATSYAYHLGVALKTGYPIQLVGIDCLRLVECMLYLVPAGIVLLPKIYALRTICLPSSAHSKTPEKFNKACMFLSLILIVLALSFVPIIIIIDMFHNLTRSFIMFMIIIVCLPIGCSLIIRHGEKESTVRPSAFITTATCLQLTCFIIFLLIIPFYLRLCLKLPLLICSIIGTLLAAFFELILSRVAFPNNADNDILKTLNSLQLLSKRLSTRAAVIGLLFCALFAICLGYNMSESFSGPLYASQTISTESSTQQEVFYKVLDLYNGDRAIVREVDSTNEESNKTTCKVINLSDGYQVQEYPPENSR